MSFSNQEGMYKHSSLIIKEGRLNLMQESSLVLGKGEEVIKSQDKKDSSAHSSPIRNILTEMANDAEASSFIGLNLKVNRFTSVAGNDAKF